MAIIVLNDKTDAIDWTVLSRQNKYEERFQTYYFAHNGNVVAANEFEYYGLKQGDLYELHKLVRAYKAQNSDAVVDIIADIHTGAVVGTLQDLKTALLD